MAGCQTAIAVSITYLIVGGRSILVQPERLFVVPIVIEAVKDQFCLLPGAVAQRVFGDPHIACLKRSPPTYVCDNGQPVEYTSDGIAVCTVRIGWEMMGGSVIMGAVSVVAIIVALSTGCTGNRWKQSQTKMSEESDTPGANVPAELFDALMGAGSEARERGQHRQVRDGGYGHLRLSDPILTTSTTAGRSRRGTERDDCLHMSDPVLTTSNRRTELDVPIACGSNETSKKVSNVRDLSPLPIRRRY